MPLAIPILTYHSANVSGNDYATNDHVAFAEDLRLLTSLGWTIANLDHVVGARLSGRPLPAERIVAITLDDGTDFDFADLDHPRWGRQRGMFGIVADFLREHPNAQPGMHVTSFVVVSSAALQELDRTCLIGAGWWSNEWWRAAVASGRWAIGNHSFDHNHLGISRSVANVAERGTFRNIADFAAAEAEIAVAAAQLRAFVPNPATALFAYPYGEANDFLVQEYFPRQHERIGVKAAFASEGGPVTEASNRWLLPRYVFGHHWTSPAELSCLLLDAAG